MAIEEELLLEFSRAQVRNDKKAMKKYIKLLSKFKVTKKTSEDPCFVINLVLLFRVTMTAFKISSRIV
jgi:hypothetical protein